MTSVFQVYIGLEPLTSSGLAGAATTLLVITNGLGVVYIEKMGRRTWLLSGAVLQSIFLAVFTGLQAHPGKETGAAAAAMIFLFIAVFGPGWAPFAVSRSWKKDYQESDGEIRADFIDSMCIHPKSFLYDTATLDFRSAYRASGLWHG